MAHRDDGRNRIEYLAYIDEAKHRVVILLSLTATIFHGPRRKVVTL